MGTAMGVLGASWCSMGSEVIPAERLLCDLGHQFLFSGAPRRCLEIGVAHLGEAREREKP